MENKINFAEYLNSIKPFTVGQIREAIEGLPDDTQILIGIPEDLDTRSDWYNLAQNYERPDSEDYSEDSEYFALTFFLKDDYDSRQF
jgi:hypothetical protein